MYLTKNTIRRISCKQKQCRIYIMFTMSNISHLVNVTWPCVIIMTHSPQWRVDHSIIINVLWRCFDQSAKQLIVGHMTIYVDWHSPLFEQQFSRSTWTSKFSPSILFQGIRTSMNRWHKCGFLQARWPSCHPTHVSTPHRLYGVYGRYQAGLCIDCKFM